MKNIIVVGSCISLTIAQKLMENIPQSQISHRIPHSRSDMLVQNIRKPEEEIPTKDELRAFVDRCGDEKETNRSYDWTFCNSKERYKSLVRSLEAASILIMDNLYDMRSHLYFGDEELGEDVLVKFIANANYQNKDKGLLDLKESEENFEEFLKWVLRINPAIKIFMISTPPSGFYVVSNENIAKRCTAFNLKNTYESIFVFPPNVLLSKFHVKGAVYYDQRVNASYAKVIYASLYENAIFEDYQKKIMAEFLEEDYFLNGLTGDETTASGAVVAAKHPYVGLSENKYWKSAVASKNPLAIKDLYTKKIDILPTTKVATFGSCFAQHIGKNLRSRGVNCLDYEPAPMLLEKSQHQEFGFDMYSARYGNVYTIRQMLQLLQRATGEFSPVASTWSNDTRFVDPFRPTITPSGYFSPEQVVADRKRHLKKVLQVLGDLDLFVFTFGLTEAWVDLRDGAVFPVCPGISGGLYDAEKYAFRNFSYSETYNDFLEFRKQLHELNPNAKILLTVSPVPLTATASDEHILVATTRSKSILRSVCAALFEEFDDVDYFPSYEIISSFPYKGFFYESNMRNISQEGVKHVMSHFFNAHDNLISPASDDSRTFVEESEAKCDDFLLYDILDDAPE